MSRRLHLLSVPYLGGQRDVGMGLGPTELLERRHLADHFAQLGYDVAVTVVHAPDLPQEIRRTFGLDAQLAEAVSEVIAADGFPLVLSGNCNSALGTTAGFGGTDLGIVWFDACGQDHLRGCAFGCARRTEIIHHAMSSLGCAQCGRPLPSDAAELARWNFGDLAASGELDETAAGMLLCPNCAEDDLLGEYEVAKRDDRFQILRRLAYVVSSLAASLFGGTASEFDLCRRLRPCTGMLR